MIFRRVLDRPEGDFRMILGLVLGWPSVDFRLILDRPADDFTLIF